MNQKKNKKIVVILLIIVAIIIIIASASLVYLTTDLFKSDKELFFKYASQLGDFENGIIDNQLVQYFEKQKISSYSNDGTLRNRV